jgi:tetratricopeptide (TPR) repeat protein
MKILRLFGLCSLAAFMMFATGCMSMRFATTLPPSGQRDHTLGLVKVNITNVVVSSPAGSGNIVPDIARKDFMAAARERYPLIFDEDRNALPVNVEVVCEYDDYHERALRYALLTVLSVGIVPSLAPPGANEAGDFSVRVSADDPDQGPIAYPPVTFQRRNVAWWTVFTPLGLIPVPGQTDVPRSFSTMFGDDEREWTRKGGVLTLASCVEAVVQALEAGDLGRMDTAGQNVGFHRDVADLLQGASADVRIAAARDLGDRGDLRAKDVLRLAVYDPEPAVCDVAADALMRLGQPSTADELRRLGKLYPALDQYEADFKLMAESAAGRAGGKLEQQRKSNLLGRMITLVPELIPALSIPDEALALFGKGAAFQKKAKAPADFELAVGAYDEALRIAPWWADAYYSRALAEGAAGRFADAARDFQFYLLSNPPAQAADEARARLLQMQAKQAQTDKKPPAAKPQ